jgi:hypothetical protein
MQANRPHRVFLPGINYHPKDFLTRDLKAATPVRLLPAGSVVLFDISQKHTTKYFDLM